MPDPTATTEPITLDQAEGVVLEAAARELGVAEGDVSMAWAFEQTEVWGGGVLWYIAQVDRAGLADPLLFYVDLVSREVVTGAEYDTCWRALLAAGGPFELPPTPAPSFSPGPGFAGITPGKAYEVEAFRPRVEDDTDILDDAKRAQVLAAAAGMIATVTGKPYVDALARFSCYGDGRCQLEVLWWVANAEDPDVLWFMLREDGSELALEPAAGYWGTNWRSVPHDAVVELVAIVEADAVANRRANEYSALCYASWYPKHPQMLSLTYCSPGGVVPGPPMANATTHLLTIKIDIVERRVIDYGEIVVDG